MWKCGYFLNLTDIVIISKVIQILPDELDISVSIIIEHLLLILKPYFLIQNITVLKKFLKLWNCR